MTETTFDRKETRPVLENCLIWIKTIAKEDMDLVLNSQPPSFGLNKIRSLISELEECLS